MAGKKRSGLANDKRGYVYAKTTKFIPIPITYTVTYYGSNNTYGIPPVDGNSPYSAGSTVTVLGNSLSRIGYTFNNWYYTDSNGDPIYYSPGNTFVINDNITLYANWTPIEYDVNYHDGDGNIVNDKHQAGSTVTVADNTFSRTGYIFIEWNTSFGSYLPRNTFVINGDINLYAQWMVDGTVTGGITTGGTV